MEYFSTRGGEKVSASLAIQEGLAPDGGLYVPARFPAYSIEEICDKSYVEMAAGIFSLYLREFSPEQIAEAAVNAYLPNFPKAVAPCVGLGDTGVLELWHGPTAAFKDMALQVLPRLMKLAGSRCGNDRELVVLTATSGDTGKAALEGFKDVPGVKIIVFYPKDGVSATQELQMRTTGGSNTYVIGVEGNFDDCQTGVKALFADAGLNRQLAENGKQFTSANSINWGRLLPQIVYYYYGYSQMCRAGRVELGAPIDIAVPTGNFGNILAAWYAKKMGLPVHRLLCASNENDVLTEVLTTGVYNSRRPLLKTTSPSMDILVSSNFERFLFDLSGNNAEMTAQWFRDLRESGRFTVEPPILAAMQEAVYGGKADSAQAAATIKKVYDEYGYLLDPHTAVGYTVVEEYWRSHGREYPVLLASTANPYKFSQAVLEALGLHVENVRETDMPQLLEDHTGVPIPESLRQIASLPVRHNRFCAKDKMRDTVTDILRLA
ncbi:MAG: threonine synthase [Firmicutes bacterium]|nr:threonine synthase [Bacillota bacterium]